MQLCFGVLTPGGTPKDIVNKLAAQIARIIAVPGTKKMLVAHGLDGYTPRRKNSRR